MSIRTRTKAFVAAGTIAALALVGSAFAASNTLPAPSVNMGYGSQTITGVSVTSVTYNKNPAGDTITSVGLVVTGNTTASTISIAFNTDTPATCSDPGTFLSPSTTYDCTVSQPISTATKFALVAS